MFRFIVILLLCTSINAQNNFFKITKQGICQTVKVENQDEAYSMLLLSKGNKIDTIISKVPSNILDVFFQDSICNVLTIGNDLKISKYIKKEDKWSYCFSKYQYIMSSVFDLGINIQTASFLDEQGENLFVLKTIFSGKKQASILKRVDNIYHQIYISDEFLSFQKSGVKDSLFQVYKKEFYLKKGEYDLGAYLRDSTLYEEHLDRPTERGRLVRQYYIDFIFEKILNEKGLTFSSEEEKAQIQKIPEVISDSTGVYICLVTKEDLIRPIIKENEDSILIFTEKPLQVKIAEPLKEQDKISWSLLSKDFLSVTYPDNSQKIYYIYYKPTLRIPGVFPMESCPPRAFHSPVFYKRMTNECPTEKEK